MRKHWSESLHQITNDRDCRREERKFAKQFAVAPLQIRLQGAPIFNDPDYHLPSVVSHREITISLSLVKDQYFSIKPFPSKFLSIRAHLTPRIQLQYANSRETLSHDVSKTSNKIVSRNISLVIPRGEHLGAGGYKARAPLANKALAKRVDGNGATRSNSVER